MPKRAAITPNVRLNTTLPPRLSARLSLHLYSEVEGRIPKGAFQSFIVDRTQEFFDSRRVDLGAFMDLPPGEVVVSGSDAAINKIINHLKGEHRE